MGTSTSADSSAFARASYVREQTARELLGNTFHLYWRNIRVLFLIVVLPTFPFNFWDFYIEASGGPMLNPASIMSYFVEMFPSLAITVAVSDICLGNQPSVLRSYSRVFSRDLLPLALTYIALIAVIALGFVALIVPGFVLLAWFMFVTAVMILERRFGREAFVRSKNLGNGLHLRNLGVVAVVFLALFSVMIAYESAFLLFADTMNIVLRSAVDALFLALIVPMVYVSVVLLYYDLRARKDAYDSTALTEDLLR